MSMREVVKTLRGNKRQFVLLRVADMDTKAALKLVGVVRGTYNSWLQNQEFIDAYRLARENSDEYKQEAIQLLRRDNQLAAVLLESKIIAKMKVEIDLGEYELIKTNLAKEVYSRLLNDLDYSPQTVSLTWEQRIENLQIPQQETSQLEEGQTVEGEVVDGQKD